MSAASAEAGMVLGANGRSTGGCWPLWRKRALTDDTCDTAPPVAEVTGQSYERSELVKHAQDHLSSLGEIITKLAEQHEHQLEQREQPLEQVNLDARAEQDYKVRCEDGTLRHVDSVIELYPGPGPGEDVASSGAISIVHGGDDHERRPSEEESLDPSLFTSNGYDDQGLSPADVDVYTTATQDLCNLRQSSRGPTAMSAAIACMSVSPSADPDEQHVSFRGRQDTERRETRQPTRESTKSAASIRNDMGNSDRPHRIWRTRSPASFLDVNNINAVGLIIHEMGRESNSDWTGTSSGAGGGVETNRICRSLNQFIVPSSVWINVVWEIIGAFLILYDVVTIPMASFHLEREPNAMHIILSMSWMVTVYWTADIPRHFFTSYEENGIEIFEFRKVAKNYLKGWLVLDVLVVASDWVGTMLHIDAGATRSWRLNSKIIRAIRIVRAVRLIRIYKMIQVVLELMDHVQSQQLIILIKATCLLIGILLIAHYLACYWYFITTLDDWLGLRTDWVRKMDLKDAEVSILYTVALHWSLAQSGFVSTTDTYPTNWIERVYGGSTTVIWLMIICSLVAICTVWGVQLRDLNIASYSQEADLRTYMKEHSISDSLSNRVVRFFRKNFKQLKAGKKEEDILHFNELPVAFRIELHKEVHMPVLSKHPAFILLFDEDGLQTLCHLVMVEKHYDAGQSLFIEAQQANSMVFIRTGELSYYFRSLRTACVRVEPDTWISEAVLWMHWKHAGCLITSTSCEVTAFNMFKFHAVMAASSHACGRMDVLREYARLAVQNYADEEDGTDLWDVLRLERLARQALVSNGIDAEEEEDHTGSYMGNRIKKMATRWKGTNSRNSDIPEKKLGVLHTLPIDEPQRPRRKGRHELATNSHCPPPSPSE